ncbi:MAG: 23S rRNA (uracil(1939)-C(5))-methyltransferase RlmD, partial [Anaerovoracaceae bacterium]
ATLARDLRYLCDRGYGIETGAVVDQFCETVHVECVVLMSRVQK